MSPVESESFIAARITRPPTVADVDKAKAAGVRFDWRAAAYFLALIDPQRFSTSRNVSVQVNAPQQTNFIAGGGEENLRKLIGMWVVGYFETSFSVNAAISSIVQTRLAIPLSIAGVTRKVW
jgi:hypothetical protein